MVSTAFKLLASLGLFAVILHHATCIVVNQGGELDGNSAVSGYVSKCYYEDYKKNGVSCDMTCGFILPANTMLYYSSYIYFTNDENIYIMLSENFYPYSDGTSSVSYPATNHPGIHKCFIRLYNTNTYQYTDYYHYFKENNSTKSPAIMDGACNFDYDCYALGATCANNECQCLASNNIPYDDDEDYNLACFGPGYSSFYHDNIKCNIDDECNYAYSYTECSNHRCVITRPQNSLTGGDIAGITVACLAFVLALIGICVGFAMKK